MAKQSLEYYIDRYVCGTITREEIVALRLLLSDAAKSQELDELMKEQLTQWENADMQFTGVIKNVQQGIDQQIAAQMHKDRPIHLIHFLRRWRWAVAAVVMLAIGSGVYYWRNSTLGVVSNKPEVVKRDIMPGTNRAMLTVGNKTIELNSNKEGIINNGNQLTYSDGSSISETLHNLALTTYNSLSTPRGGQYQAVLPDGSKVWLNAASSIKFPSKFSDKERRVEVSGEAYFEVAGNATKPFKVYGGGQEIEVLGTSFNINVYDDEPTKTTTLITGSIKIASNDQTAILKPGQQASISIMPITKIKQITVQTTDIEQTLAWKNGIFNLQNLSLQEFAWQLERWYDIEVRYEGNIPDKSFEGKLRRDVKLSDIMSWFSKLGIQNRLEGRTLTLSTN